MTEPLSQRELSPIFMAAERYEGRWVTSRTGLVAHLAVDGGVACGEKLTATSDADSFDDGCRRCVRRATLRPGARTTAPHNLQSALQALSDRDARIKELRVAIDAALHELGVPTDNYPAPVANAVTLLRAALDDSPEDVANAGGGDPLPDHLAALERAWTIIWTKETPEWQPRRGGATSAGTRPSPNPRSLPMNTENRNLPTPLHLPSPGTPLLRPLNNALPTHDSQIESLKRAWAETRTQLADRDAEIVRLRAWVEKHQHAYDTGRCPECDYNVADYHPEFQPTHSETCSVPSLLSPADTEEEQR